MNWFYKTFLDMPSWIRPKNFFSVAYLVHIGIIAFIVLALLQLFTGGDMLNFQNWLFSLPLIGVGDIFAETITRLN